MRITIDIDETCVYKYGTFVLTGLSSDPDSKLDVAIPGFKYTIKKDQPVFRVNRSYGDERDLLQGVKNNEQSTDGTEAEESNERDNERLGEGITGNQETDNDVRQEGNSNECSDETDGSFEAAQENYEQKKVDKNTYSGF